MSDDGKKTDAQERFEKARKLLGGLKEGGTVDIIRTRPGWAKGLQETIEVGEDDPVDLNYVKRTWGGHSLKLVAHDSNRVYLGAATVTFTKPPLDRGRPITPEDLDPQLHSHNPQPVQQDSGDDRFLKMMQMMMDNSKENTRLLVDGLTGRLERIEQQGTRQPAAAAPAQAGDPSDPLDGIEKTADTIEKLEGIRERLGATGGMDQAITDGMQKLMDFWIMKEKGKMDLEREKVKANARPAMPERQQPAAQQPAAAPQQPTAAAQEPAAAPQQPPAEEPAQEPQQPAGEPVESEPGIDPSALEFMEQAKKQMQDASPEELEYAMTQFMGMMPEGFVEERAGDDDEPEQEVTRTIDVDPVESKAVTSPAGQDATSEAPAAGGTQSPRL